MPLIPTVIESDGRVERAFDIYSRLLRDRIVFLGREVDDEIANLIVAQFLLLEADDPERDISLYVNSPGGSAYAGMAIYDAMQHVQPDVSTICFGIGMSAAAMIMAGGAAGKRFALPNAKLMIHQGSAGFRGAPSDIQIAAREVAATTTADGRDHRASRGPRHRGGDGGHRPRPLHDTSGGSRVRTGRRDHAAAARPPREVASDACSPLGVHHVGLAVVDLDAAIETYTALLGGKLEHREILADQGVEAASVVFGSSRIELLAPTGEDTPVGRFLRSAAPACTTSRTRSTTSPARLPISRLLGRS